MTVAQRVIVAAVVPAVVFVVVWFLSESGRYPWRARETWWVWLLAILTVGVFQWIWWADARQRRLMKTRMKATTRLWWRNVRRPSPLQEPEPPQAIKPTSATEWWVIGGLFVLAWGVVMLMAFFWWDAAG